MIQPKSFLKVWLFSIFTLGIYYLFFMYQTTEELNQMAGEDGYTVKPSRVIWLTILTLGIYELVWMYRMGNRMQLLGQKNEVPILQNGSSYLLWAVFGSLLCGVGFWLAVMFFLANFNFLAIRYNQAMEQTPMAPIA